jgi:formylglycine-generating enzyme required for sulfatase activity
VNAKDGLTYVYVGPGSFMMGCSAGDEECYDDEKPAKRVTISKGFYLSESEVTQAAYQRVTWKNPSNFNGLELPVEKVTWAEASATAGRLGPAAHRGGVGIRSARREYGGTLRRHRPRGMVWRQ